MEEKIVQAVEKQEIKKKSKTRLWIVLVVAVMAAIVAYILFRGAYLETIEIGEQYINIFWQNVKYMTITFLCNFVFLYFVIYMVNAKIKKGLKEFFIQEKKTMPKLINKSVAFVGAILISALTSNFILQKAMLCFNSAQFGVQDPIFGLDIGYFIFQKPFMELILWYFAIMIVALLVYTVVYYIVTFNMFFDGIDRKTLKNSKLIKQITSFILLISIIIACFVILKTQDIGTEKFLTLKDKETSYSIYGAGFTDVTIKLWGYRILAIIVVVSVYIAIKSFKEGKTKKLVLSICVVPAYLIGMVFVLIVFQAVFVTTNELDKEKQYIANNIQYTKNAYGINIEEVNLGEGKTITSQDMVNYKTVLDNIAIVSQDTVLKDLKNGQTAKGYYSYRDTQIGKYVVDGKEQLIYLSPREIVSSSRNLQ